MAIRKYIHLEPGEEVESISGHYEVEKELRFSVGDREVLCVLGYTAWDKSCCGVGGCRYIMVPGYIVNYKNQKDDHGLFTTEVEMINDQDEKKKIKELIKDTGEYVQMVDFW
ncbi:MAG: hypothetical protein JRI95_10515 [Deltaproteobacteria bacterium]|nr:hypothetical protein [Deltaproteobacteria bacterium]MBW2085660.1 hypothetical protein [Deltaproteobacteria bacterium]